MFCLCVTAIILNCYRILCDALYARSGFYFVVLKCVLTEFDSSLLCIFKKSANRLEFKVACRMIEYLKLHEFVAIPGINSRNTYDANC